MSRIGLYGKMPSVGDFVCRGFSPDTTERLDHLLQAALVSACNGGCDLHDMFETAPVFMMSIRAGVMGSAGMSVLVIPSCDRVGRLFPLCAGIEWDGAQADSVRLEWPTAELMTLLCAAMVNISHAQGSPDDLMAALPSASAWLALGGDACPFHDVQDMTVPGFWSSSMHLWFEGPASAMTQASQVVCGHLPWVAQALGCVLSPQGQIESFFSTRALQTPPLLGALFDADWSGHGWDTHQVRGNNRKG